MIEKHINVTLYVSGVVTDQAKIASFDPEVHVPDEVTKFVEGLKADPRFAYMHTIAMSDGDTYGQNLNGDIFGWDELLADQTPDEAKKNPGDMAGTVVPRYKTFEQAKFFKHHANSPYDDSYGDVPLAVINIPMKRIELIIRIARQDVPEMNMKGAPDISERLDGGGMVPVSMGCSCNPNTPVLTSTGYVPISEIAVGTQVYTHEGRFRSVTELHRRVWTGDTYRIRLNGLPEIFDMTGDHPFFAKTFSGDRNDASYRKEMCKWTRSPDARFEESQSSGWIRTRDMRVGDVLFHVPVKFEDPTPLTSIDEARFLGYYVADGSYVGGENNTGVSFTVSVNGHAADELPGITSRLFGLETTGGIHPGSDRALNVNVHGLPASGFIASHVTGRTSKTKVLSQRFFGATPEFILAFIGAWHSSDGFVDYKGVHWSTANYHLALQLRDLLALVGMPSTVNRILHPAGRGYNNTDTVEYVVNIQLSLAQPIQPHSRKLTGIALPENKQSSVVKILSDGTLAYPIKSIERYDAESVQTYNFEVEDDESYSLSGIVSHNCRIGHEQCSYCGAENEFISQRCPHMANQMGELMPNGVKVAALNFKPRFFDISKVSIPADPIAMSLAKVAAFAPKAKKPNDAKDVGCKAANWRRKWADIVKIIPADAIEKTCREPGEQTLVAPCELSDDELKSAAAAGSFDDVVSTATAMGIVFNPLELAKLASYSGYENVDDVSFSGIDVMSVNYGVVSALKNKMAERSGYFIQPHTEGWHPMKVAESGHDDVSDFYAFYRTAIGYVPFSDLSKAASAIPAIVSLLPHNADTMEAAAYLTRAGL